MNRDRVPTGAPSAHGDKYQHTALLVLYSVLTVVAIWIVHNFVPAVLWAGVLSIALWPVLERAEHWPVFRHRPRLVAAIMVLCVGICFVVPLIAGVTSLAGETHYFSQQLHGIEENGLPAPAWLGHLPGGTAIRTWWENNLADPHSASDAIMDRVPHGSILAVSGHLGRHVLHALITFGFTLLVMFFVFAAGVPLREQLLNGLRRAFGPDGASLATRMAVSVRGTVSGLVLVGLGEGALLGIAYFSTGVPHAILLAAVSAVAAMLPFCAPIIFTAAALFLLSQGSSLAAGILFAVGVIIVFVAEHFIRPALIGGAARLPFLLVLLGILGGAETLGLLGIFVGPALMTILMVIWQEYTERDA